MTLNYLDFFGSWIKYPKRIGQCWTIRIHTVFVDTVDKEITPHHGKSSDTLARIPRLRRSCKWPLLKGENREDSFTIWKEYCTSLLEIRNRAPKELSAQKEIFLTFLITIQICYIYIFEINCISSKFRNMKKGEENPNFWRKYLFLLWRILLLRHYLTFQTL